MDFMNERYRFSNEDSEKILGGSELFDIYEKMSRRVEEDLEREKRHFEEFEKFKREICYEDCEGFEMERE